MISPALLLHRQSRQGVSRFTRLGHTDGEGVGGQRRRRIAKLTGVMHAGGHTSQLLQQMGPHQSRMAAGATGQDFDALHTLQQSLLQGQRHQRILRTAGLGQMAHQPTGRCFRLLMDFLEHEVAKTALVRHVISALQLRWRALLPFTSGVVELNAQRSQ